MPNKGVRQQPPVPDRLKDAMAYFGNEQRQNVVMEDTPFVPQDKRQNLLKETLSMQQNMRSASKLDLVKVALSKLHGKNCDAEDWNDVFLFMRTTEFCTELVKNETDVFPRGSKLWIELESCEERRTPYLLKLPNGMVVLPIFSMEEYQDYYFSRIEAFESCWFPVPRMGTRYEAFCKLEFPVCGLGPLQRLSALATMALRKPGSELGILINPGQRCSKFLTYPEMVYLARQKKHTMSNEGAITFHKTLRKTFDTTKLDFVRMSPEDALEHLAKSDKQGVPMIARLELQLLVFPFAEVSEVYVRTVPKPKWKKLVTGGSETITLLEFVVHDESMDVAARKKWRAELAEIVQQWSFMAEFNSDIHIEFVASAPTSDTNATKLYDGAVDGRLYRQHVTFKGLSLRQALDFDAPIVNADGKTVDFGPKVNY